MDKLRDKSLVFHTLHKAFWIGPSKKVINRLIHRLMPKSVPNFLY